MRCEICGADQDLERIKGLWWCRRHRDLVADIDGESRATS